MNLRKAVIALAAAGALGAGTIGATQPASAVTPAWVVPAIVVAAVGGIALGAAADNAYAYGPPHYHAGAVSVRPASGCWIENRRSGPVEVCRR